MIRIMETRNENASVAFVSTHPGEVVRDWIKDVGIKQRDLAARMGIPATRLNELIKGKRSVTDEIAKKLAETLGMDASYWMRLQIQYDYNEKLLALRKEVHKQADNKESALLEIFNLKELYKHLNIDSVSPINRVCNLLTKLDASYEDMTDRTAIVGGCFKHSDTLRIDERNMRTWILLAQYEAANKHVDGEYSIEGADEAATEIATKANDGTLKEADIISILSQHGIAYAVVPKLDGCPIDAYSVMIKQHRPAIVVTHRHNNMQKLIFDVLHEIGHITKHMERDILYSDFINMEYSQNNPIEREANEYAQNMLIPIDVWRDIINFAPKTVREDFICKKIGDRAKSFNVNPYIAVARYKHESRLYRGRAYAPTCIE